MTRKSRGTQSYYRPGASRGPVSLATFREQMTDYAKPDRLKELRAGKRMSRESVAHEVGVTTKTIYAWENGGAIKWPNAKRLAAFYGVDPRDIVSRDPDAGLSPDYVELRRIETKLDAILDHLGIEVSLEDVLNQTADDLGLPPDPGEDGERNGQEPPPEDQRAA